MDWASKASVFVVLVPMVYYNSLNVLEEPRSNVGLLMKSMNGLKQAPREWYSFLNRCAPPSVTSVNSFPLLLLPFSSLSARLSIAQHYVIVLSSYYPSPSITSLFLHLFFTFSSYARAPTAPLSICMVYAAGALSSFANKLLHSVTPQIIELQGQEVTTTALKHV